jgi:hypothetical protein
MRYRGNSMRTSGHDPIKNIANIIYLVYESFYRFLFKINIPEATKEMAQTPKAIRNKLLMYWVSSSKRKIKGARQMPRIVSP